MNLFNLTIIFLVILIKDNHGFKTNHKISRSSKSIFSNKEYKESVLPARYTAKNIKLEDISSKINTPSSSFLGMDYPMNIVDSSKPFYFPTTIDEVKNDAMLSPFPDYVKSTFKTLNDKTASDKIHAKIKDEYKNIFSKAMSNLQSNAHSRIIEKENDTSPVLENYKTLEVESVNEEIAESNDTSLRRNFESSDGNSTETNCEDNSRDYIESIETELIIYDDTDNVNFDDIILISDKDNNSTDDSNEFLVEIFRVLEVIEENLNNSTQRLMDIPMGVPEDEKLGKDKSTV